MSEDLRRYMSIVEGTLREDDEEAGFAWEEELMDVFAPHAAEYMASVVEKSFKSLYPDVPFNAWANGEGVTATTNPDLWNSDMVKPDVFGNKGVSHWEATFMCGPLYNMEDGKRYLELLIEDASSGDYKGVWKAIAKEWASYAGSQLKDLNADGAALSVDDDYSSGAWESIARSAGLTFINHD